MKKTLSILLAALVLTITALPVFAADEAEVYVSISDGDGNLVLAYEPITVSDADGDGTLSISDALYFAHEAKYEGGAEAGFTTELTQYGISMTTLWGIDNGGSYGYYINNASPLSLSDAVKDGDHIKAYAYADLETWSDTYCYFEADTITVTAGEGIALTLTSSGYDEAWNPVTLPVEGAVITVNGKPTDAVTDADGKTTLTVDEVGYYMISAVSANQVLVPPVCIAAVEAPVEAPEATDTIEPEVTETEQAPAVTSPKTADIFAAVSLICAVMSGAVIGKKRRKNEI